jgi:hypothetical protein
MCPLVSLLAGPHEDVGSINIAVWNCLTEGACEPPSVRSKFGILDCAVLLGLDLIANSPSLSPLITVLAFRRPAIPFARCPDDDCFSVFLWLTAYTLRAISAPLFPDANI